MRVGRRTEYIVFVFFGIQTVLFCIATDAYFGVKDRLAEERRVHAARVKELKSEIADLSLDISLMLPPCMKVDEFIATAYEPSELSCGRWAKYGLTRTGTRPGYLRTAAVDPEVIPLGSLFFVSGLGWFLAEDTGGAIRGKRIDIFFNSIKEAKAFGVKRVTVYYQDRRCFSKYVLYNADSEVFQNF